MYNKDVYKWSNETYNPWRYRQRNRSTMWDATNLHLYFTSHSYIPRLKIIVIFTSKITVHIIYSQVTGDCIQGTVRGYHTRFTSNISLIVTTYSIITCVRVSSWCVPYYCIDSSRSFIPMALFFGQKYFYSIFISFGCFTLS